MTNADYHGDVSRISKSGLDKIAKSPAHYFAKYLDPNRVKEEPTKALIDGKAVHAAVLEPEVFARDYVLAPKVDRRTKEGKQVWEDFQNINAGKEIISLDTYEMCQRICDAVRSHVSASYLFKSGKAEQTIFWDDNETGAPCKMRADWISSEGYIVDLKTTEDASAYSFGRSAHNYRYDVQAAFYSDGFYRATGNPAQAFIFIAVEKEPPYAIGVYFMDQQVYELGREKYKRDLQTYMDCRKSGIWPGYDPEAMPLKLPAYAFNKI